VASQASKKTLPKSLAFPGGMPIDAQRMIDQSARSVLIISQVYVPDPTAVGQHFADVAEKMVARGWEVTVYTSARAYGNPSLRFPRFEERNGVQIRRFPLSSFGKGSIPVRLLAQALFMIQAVTRAMFIPRLSAIVVSTSPPFAGFGGAVVSLVKRAPLLWWVMDLNPDQMVAAGKLRPTSLFVRVFDWMNRVTLRRAARVIALDRFMAARLNRKVDVSAKLLVAPPWPHNETPPLDDAGVQRLAYAGTNFRKRHGLENYFVVMYSGNHAIQHPLDTLLDAAKQLESEPALKFVFIGGGAGKVGVEQRIAAGATNILSLPYQPLETLEDSLGAGDLHVVSMGPEVVGIVHPCKIYGAMAVGRPILFFGPRESHAGEIVEPQHLGWRVEHGDVAATVAAIRQAAGLARPERLQMGQRAAALITADFSRQHLRNEVCSAVEAMLQ
jgi:colanic acid biosynthesis glycosyl transferase WcaI